MNTLQQETHTISAGNPPTGTYFEEPQLSSGQIKCSCADFKKSQWCKHMPPGAVKTGWNEPQLSAEIQKRITEIIDEYVISHKGNAQCRCIEGARGHLRAKLFGLFDTFSQKHKGAAKIVVCPKCNYPEESCKCVTPEAIATALEEQKKAINDEWLYQKANDHDARIRADERQKVLAEVESWLVDIQPQEANPKYSPFHDGYNTRNTELRAKLVEMKGGK